MLHHTAIFAVLISATTAISTKSCASAFTIDIDIVNSVHPQVEMACRRAAKRLEKTIQRTCAFPSVTARSLQSSMKKNPCTYDGRLDSELTDSLHVYLSNDMISEHKYATASACRTYDDWVRVGEITVNRDRETSITSDAWEAVCTHELLHLLGFNRNHGLSDLIKYKSGTDVVGHFTYLGPDHADPSQSAALCAHCMIGGEADEFVMTADGHYLEAEFKDELMSQYAGDMDSIADAPMSIITLAVLEDIGYEVDYNQADDYMLSSKQDSCTSICRGRHFGNKGGQEIAPPPEPENENSSTESNSCAEDKMKGENMVEIQWTATVKHIDECSALVGIRDSLTTSTGSACFRAGYEARRNELYEEAKRLCR